MLPTDHVIVTPWAPDSVGSPQIVCCFPSKLPGWSPGEDVLPALPPQPPRLPLFLCTALLCSNSDGCWRSWISPRVILPCSPCWSSGPCPAMLTTWWEGFPTVFQSLGKRSRQWLEPPKKVPESLPIPNPQGTHLLPQFPPFVVGEPAACWGGWLQDEGGKNSVSGGPSVWRAHSCGLG